MKFFIAIDTGNAAIPEGEAGGWTPDTLRGIRQTLGLLMQRMERDDDVAEGVLDLLGNRVGTARFIAADDDLLVVPVTYERRLSDADNVESILDGVVTMTNSQIIDSIV